MTAETIHWEKTAAEEDYAAAFRFMSLLLPEPDARKVVAALKRAPVQEYEAKDLLRASQAHLLKTGNPKVHHTLKKISKGKAISPVLLVRGDVRVGTML